jgi:hypothetical protein
VARPARAYALKKRRATATAGQEVLLSTQYLTVSEITPRNYRLHVNFGDRPWQSDLTGFVLETAERHLSILADLDEVAVGITHVAAPIPAAVV